MRDGFTVLPLGYQVGGGRSCYLCRRQTLIRGGKGYGKGLRRRESDVIALFIDQSNVRSNSNVIVESIMHSTVMATERISHGRQKRDYRWQRRPVLVSCITLGNDIGTKTESGRVSPTVQQELKMWPEP